MQNQLYVTLTGSDNTFLTYPCDGLLHILEYSTMGSIINAVFRVAKNGKLSAPVDVKNARFEFSPATAQLGGMAVLDLQQRQSAGQEWREHPHTVIVDGTSDVIAMLPNALAVELFVQANCLRIKEDVINSGPNGIQGRVIVRVYPTIGTRALAAICAILSNDESSSDAELKEHLMREFSLDDLQAQQQLANREQFLKALP